MIAPSELEKLVKPVEMIQVKGEVLAYIVVGHAGKLEGSKETRHLLSLARAGSAVTQVLKIHPELASVVHIEAVGDSQALGPEAKRNQRVEVEAVCRVQPPYVTPDGQPVL